jgi:hypothetical protein
MMQSESYYAWGVIPPGQARFRAWDERSDASWAEGNLVEAQSPRERFHVHALCPKLQHHLLLWAQTVASERTVREYHQLSRVNHAHECSTHGSLAARVEPVRPVQRA